MTDTDIFPNLFALPAGVDFGAAFLAGLIDRYGSLPPEEFARIEIYVNTRRTQRHLQTLFDQGPARLLPRIRLITDLARAAPAPGAPVPPLRRKLELAQMVDRLLQADPGLAPRSARFTLADSLSGLLDEMQGEAVPPRVISELDVSDQSGHWQRTLRFVDLVARYFDDETSAEAAQRKAIETLDQRWSVAPPDHPVIVAGSTGSRGATSLFMELVARLPQGAVVLPGFDFDLPAPVWDAMNNALSAEDHPQFRFKRLAEKLGMSPLKIRNWAGAEPVQPARNRLISLALRPAPVTDQWIGETGLVPDAHLATKGLALLEAETPRQEAEAIAFRMRHALETGQTVALITPDRMLTRQVAAALDRWSLVPDDSAGTPLPLTPPGRFLRQVAEVIGTRLTAEALLGLLKHPLCHTGQADRGPHLLLTRELELYIRKKRDALSRPRATQALGRRSA